MGSVFKQIKASVPVDLPQYYIGELQKAAKLEISSRLLKYDPDIDGVILSFTNVKLISKTFYNYADFPFVHGRVQAVFTVFRPYIGCQLPAAVTFVSSSAISLIIFDYFQGSIDLAEHRENWTFRADKWVKKDSEIGFGKNDFVIVEVTNVSPNNEGYALNFKILRKSEIPPMENNELDVTNEFQDDAE